MLHALKNHWLAWLFLIIAVLLSVLLGSQRVSAHGDAQWIEDGGFKNGNDITCCGPTDCHRLPPNSYTPVEGGYRLMIDGRDYFAAETDTIKGVRTEAWACYSPNTQRIRCFFKPHDVV